MGARIRDMDYIFRRNNLFNTRFRNFALTVSVGVALLVFSKNINEWFKFIPAILALVFALFSSIFSLMIKFPEDGLTLSSRQQVLGWISLIVSFTFTITTLIVVLNMTEKGKSILSTIRNYSPRMKPNPSTPVGKTTVL